MGEAKRRAAHNASPFTLLTDAARSEKLGIDPFPTAFDFIYGMVEAVFTKAGGVNHELIGIDFENGKPTGVNVLLVNNVEDVPRLRARMLERWAMVAQSARQGRCSLGNSDQCKTSVARPQCSARSARIPPGTGI